MPVPPTPLQGTVFSASATQQGSSKVLATAAPATAAPSRRRRSRALRQAGSEWLTAAVVVGGAEPLAMKSAAEGAFK